MNSRQARQSWYGKRNLVVFFSGELHILGYYAVSRIHKLFRRNWGRNRLKSRVFAAKFYQRLWLFIFIFMFGMSNYSSICLIYRFHTYNHYIQFICTTWQNCRNDHNHLLNAMQIRCLNYCLQPPINACISMYFFLNTYIPNDLGETTQNILCCLLSQMLLC